MNIPKEDALTGPKRDLDLRAIKTLHFVIGTKCNQHCKMCYQGDFSTIINPNIWKEKLLPLYPYLDVIVLQGGEPTSIQEAKDFTQYVLSVNPKLKFELVTNGKALNRYWYNLLCLHGHTINISINATSKFVYDQITTAGDFDLVIENTKRIIHEKIKRQSKLIVRLSFVILSENLHQLPDFIHMANELGANDVIIYFDTSCLPTQKKETILSILDQALELKVKYHWLNIYNLDHVNNFFRKNKNAERMICPKGLQQLFVDQHGHVKTCCLSIITIGNLNRKSLPEIISGKKMVKFKNDIMEKKYKFCRPECSLLRDAGVTKKRTPMLPSFNALFLDFVTSPRSTLKKIRRQFNRIF